jgi:general L-amino acid transport system permease protein
MNSDTPSTSRRTLSEIPFWRDERVLRAAAQIVSAIAIIGFVIWVVTNFKIAAEARGLALSFEFLQLPADFPISDSIIPYDPTRSFGYAFLVGLLKTFVVSGIGIVLATILGTIVGLARLSSNWLLSRLALIYIEFHRNIPLLVLLFIWYFPVFNRLPAAREALVLPGPTYLSDRGIYFPWFNLTEGGRAWLIYVLVGIILAIIAWVVLRRRREQTGKPTYFTGVSLAILFGLPALGWILVPGTPLDISRPFLDGFNYQGGLRFTPEFAALLVGLVTYTAGFIAEVVRSGMQAVKRGQVEAARAVGLTYMQVIALVIMPQALRVIIPPMISQYLNLTKNSSLALLIGYQDLFGVAKIAINQAGRVVPIFAMTMATYLTLSLITSVVLNIYNRRIQFVER